MGGGSRSRAAGELTLGLLSGKSGRGGLPAGLLFWRTTLPRSSCRACEAAFEDAVLADLRPRPHLFADGAGGSRSRARRPAGRPEWSGQARRPTGRPAFFGLEYFCGMSLRESRAALRLLAMVWRAPPDSLLRGWLSFTHLCCERGVWERSTPAQTPSE